VAETCNCFVFICCTDGSFFGFIAVNEMCVHVMVICWVCALSRFGSMFQRNILPSSSVLLNLIQVGAEVVVGNNLLSVVRRMEGNFADQS
jgi:hypothetical protein